MAGATRPLLPLAAVTAGLASGSALAAEWTLSPSGEVVTQAQQNPRLSPEEDQKHEISNGAGATASLGVQRRTERSTLTFNPSIRAFRYSDDESLDRDEEHVATSFDWTGEKISWHSTGTAARDTTLTSELGTTGLTQGNLRHESYDLSVGPKWSLSERWQLESSLESNTSRYPDGQLGLSNYRYDTALLSAVYVVSEKVMLSVYGTAGKLDSEGNGQDTRDSSANLQMQYVWSPLSSLSASVGRSWVTAGTSREKGLLYSVSASHTFEKGLLSLGVSRRQTPSGRAYLTEAEEARLNFSTQLTERLTATATATYTKRRNVLRQFDIDLERVRYSRAELGLSWRMTSTLRLGFNASNAIQQVGSAFFRDDLTGRGYELRLGLSWNGDPYVK